MNHSLKRIERLTNLIGRSLCLTTSNLPYSRTLEAIQKLAGALHNTETDDSVWCYGEHLLPLSDLIVGAYWFCSDYHSRQFSDESHTLRVLSQVYRPGCCESGPEPDSSAQYTYDALVEKLNNH